FYKTKVVFKIQGFSSIFALFA
ncbi:hypothetical protein AZ045_003885, partial [Enterobacter hormaechei]